MLVQPEPPLPILMRILEVPVFASDGTLLDKPGYHAVAKIFIQAQQRLEMAPIPKHPTAKDVAFACESIDELIGDFPFTSQSEKANAIALMLLPFARELIDGPTPLHLIEKPAPGTGGSLLAEILTIPALGRPASILSEGRDDDEWRKRITAKLLTGPIVILLDNIRRRLESSALSAAITAAVWEDRLLGHTDMIRVPVRCGWIATGNNPAMSAEIARRTIRIRLDAQVDRPWMRTNFRHPYLREWAIEHRAEIVWSLLTLVQTWIAAGRPEENITLGMFDRWAHVLGGILKVAGISGFLANLEELYDRSDAESSAWRSFVNSWWNQFQDQEVGVADLYPVVMPSDGDPIDLDLGDGNERSQKIRFGKRLMDMRDRQFDAFRILEAGMRDRAQRWHLIRVHQG